MKKKLQNIQLNFIEKAYESFCFFMPKTFSSNNKWTIFKYNNWSFLESFIYFKNFKQILSFLKRNTLQKNNKLLFILDDDVFLFFKNSALHKIHYFTKDVKEGLYFLQRREHSEKVCAVLCIGSFDKLALNKYKELNKPIIYITNKSKSGSHYTQYNSLEYHSSVLLLKSLLEDVLLLNEKKSN